MNNEQQHYLDCDGREYVPDEFDLLMEERERLGLVRKRHMPGWSPVKFVWSPGPGVELMRNNPEEWKRRIAKLRPRPGSGNTGTGSE